MAEQHASTHSSSVIEISSSVIEISSSSAIGTPPQSLGQNGCRIPTISPQPQLISSDLTTFVPFRSFFQTFDHLNDQQSSFYPEPFHQEQATIFQETTSTDSYNIPPSIDSHDPQMETQSDIPTPLSPYNVYIPFDIPPPVDFSHVIPLQFPVVDETFSSHSNTSTHAPQPMSENSNDSLHSSIHSEQSLHPDVYNSESSHPSIHSEQSLHPDVSNSELSTPSQNSHSQSNSPDTPPGPNGANQLPPIQADNHSDLSNASTIPNNNIPRGGLDDLFEQYYQETFLIFMASNNMLPEE